MTIPKQISYCWFGNNPLPKRVKSCIESWKRYCPDYKIIEWNETNYDVYKTRFISEAYKEKKWAFVSDYARLDIIYENGGIYLDTDVELISNLDSLLNNKSFFAIEKEENLIATGLGFGAEKHSQILYELKKEYEQISFYKEDGNFNLKACTYYTTEYFEQYGYTRKDETQIINNSIILNSEYFCPLDFRDGKMTITESTLGIHWYEASWFSREDKHLHDVDIKLKSIFPSSVAKCIGHVYRYGYRFFEYLFKGLLIEKIKNKLNHK